MIDAHAYFITPPQGAEEAEAFQSQHLSAMARTMRPSKILSIAAQVRAQIARGEAVTNFTVGDFAPAQFPVPELLAQGITEALAAGQTNYPPGDGLPQLRQAIVRSYAQELGLHYPEEAVLVAAGARPILYGLYRCLLDPGELVVAPAPSWNNHNYAALLGTQIRFVPARREDHFMPTAEGLIPHLAEARLLVLNSPVNPAGTLFDEATLGALCDAVLAENERRLALGARPLYVIYDQVYRHLVFGDQPHLTPVGLRPQMAAYTVFTDAISKSFSATGLRVGWMVGPPVICERVRSLMTHVGAWAPRPEQWATARFLDDEAAVADYLQTNRAAIFARLERLYGAFAAWRAEGLPVDAIAPQGTIYLSARFDLASRPGLAGEDDMLNWLLREAGCAVVPFSAFGDTLNRGWVRMSVGAVSLEEIDACVVRLDRALRALAG